MTSTHPYEADGIEPWIYFSMSKKMKKQILASVQSQPTSPEKVFEIRDDLSFLIALADQVNCQGPNDYAGLPLLGKLIVSLYALDMEVENSGIQVYLDGSSGDFAEETRGYLSAIGAKELAGLFDEIAARFPAGRIPTDRAARMDQMEAWVSEDDGERFEAVERRYRNSGEKVIPLLRDYLESRREEALALLRSRAGV
jgi:hypothetical protein